MKSDGHSQMVKTQHNQMGKKKTYFTSFDQNVLDNEALEGSFPWPRYGINPVPKNISFFEGLK